MLLLESSNAFCAGDANLHRLTVGALDGKGMGIKMDQEERWERFVNSGKVEDYLAYRGQNNQMANQNTEKVEQYERNRDSDGDGIASISYERIR